MALYELTSDATNLSLARPVLVVAMEGWIDAGAAAETALATLMSTGTPTVVATFDDDRLLDHRARRPVMHLEDGINTGLTWPETRLLAMPARAVGRDALFLVGPEPDHEWRGFCDAVFTLATQFGVALAVGLGGFPAPVPHTRPARVVATATTPDLAADVGFLPVTIDVPAGIESAIEARFAAGGLAAVGLWARVPHYVSAMPYPDASAALLETLQRVAGVGADTTELRTEARAHRDRVDELVAGNAEHTAMVRALEAQLDEEADRFANPLSGGPDGLPSGDELAAELERFLRGEGR
ncbi:MAG: hypothetical protein JWO37_250 [Acidimicrobiales bacterium]|jgi:proteasome assembly chaperone (PAC2) family protein|nr:hypothetical protein [Acidimicrobiales bacterium]